MPGQSNGGVGRQTVFNPEFRMAPTTHDGFHEAIGDAIALSITPSYLKQVGLLDKVADNEKATINQLMQDAPGKVVFLPVDGRIAIVAIHRSDIVRIWPLGPADVAKVALPGRIATTQPATLDRDLSVLPLGRGGHSRLSCYDADGRPAVQLADATKPPRPHGPQGQYTFCRTHDASEHVFVLAPMWLQEDAVDLLEVDASGPVSDGLEHGSEA